MPGSTVATTPVASILAVLLGTGLLAGGDVVTVDDVASPPTRMSLTTRFTPLTQLAICTMRSRRSGVSTVPLSVTTPSVDPTSMRTRFES